MTPFGMFVRSLRMNRHRTMKQMAHSLGVSSSYLSVLEQGKRGVPSADLLDGIAKYFELDGDQRKNLYDAALISRTNFVIPNDAPPEAYRIAQLFSQSANRLDSAHLLIIGMIIEAGQNANKPLTFNG